MHLKYLTAAAVAASCLIGISQASAQSTVECHSRNFEYDECFAGPLVQPQLVYQMSSSSCILNRTWGYSPAGRYIWVAQGCAGVFADVGGYHHGRGDTFDPRARQYDGRGHDVGAVVAGAVLGALVEGMIDDSRHNRRHTTSNDDYHGGRTICHGTGCLVGGAETYQGCHGVNCLSGSPGK